MIPYNKITLKMACTAHHEYHNYKQHEWDIYRNVFDVQIIFVLLVGNTKWKHTNQIILAVLITIVFVYF